MQERNGEILRYIMRHNTVDMKLLNSLWIRVRKLTNLWNVRKVMVVVNIPFLRHFCYFDHYPFIIFLVDQKSYADFIEKHSISEDEGITWKYTMLQKSAKRIQIFNYISEN